MLFSVFCSQHYLLCIERVVGITLCTHHRPMRAQLAKHSMTWTDVPLSSTKCWTTELVFWVYITDQFYQQSHRVQAGQGSWYRGISFYKDFQDVDVQILSESVPYYDHVL